MRSAAAMAEAAVGSRPVEWSLLFRADAACCWPLVNICAAKPSRHWQRQQQQQHPGCSPISSLPASSSCCLYLLLATLGACCTCTPPAHRPVCSPAASLLPAARLNETPAVRRALCCVGTQGVLSMASWPTGVHCCCCWVRATRTSQCPAQVDGHGSWGVAGVPLHSRVANMAEHSLWCCMLGAGQCCLQLVLVLLLLGAGDVQAARVWMTSTLT